MVTATENGTTTAIATRRRGQVGASHATAASRNAFPYITPRTRAFASGWIVHTNQSFVRFGTVWRRTRARH
jgi:hypothetical protein